MRIIFATQPIPATHHSNLRGRDVELTGDAHFELVLFEQARSYHVATIPNRSRTFFAALARVSPYGSRRP